MINIRRKLCLSNDVEVNLFYNHFRDYDPVTGRYVESDPIGLDGGLNTYGYVEGNSLHLVDPKGLAAAFPLLGLGETANLALAISLIYNMPDTGAKLNENPHTDKEYNDNNIEKIANKREYERNCDEPPPRLSDPCENAKQKLKQAQMCLASRKAFTNKWHGGVDDRHSPDLYKQLQNRIDRAKKDVERYCKC